MRTRISTLESQLTEMLSFKQHTLKKIMEIIKANGQTSLVAVTRKVTKSKSTTEKA